MCTLIYFFRPLIGEKHNNQGSICLRLIHNRRVKSITTPFKLLKEEWNSKNQQIIHSSLELARSRYLRQVEEKLNEQTQALEAIIAILDNQGRYTVDDVLDAYRIQNNSESLEVYTHKLSNNLIRLGQERTARAYRSATESLLTFNKNRGLPLRHINSCLIREYEKYLKETGKSPNTISFYMRNIRAIYNKAINDKIIHAKNENPFSKVFTGINKTRKRALSIEEIIAIEKADLLKIKDKREYESLLQCKNIFLFCFYARGMSFVDMAYLRKENLKKGIIRYYRRKTGKLIELKLSPALKQLMDYFESETKYSEYLFPIITDKSKNKRLQYENGLGRQNKDLKRLATIAGIDKHISTHVSRHSWATIAKHEKLPLSLISEGLGHSDEKTTYIYLASFERSYLDEANEHIYAAIHSRGIKHKAI